MKVDIVVATCERLPFLKRTLASIWENTRTPYRLQVIDDASRSGNREYLARLRAEQRIDGVLLRPKRAGIVANLTTLYEITRSALVIYCDDDQLCPRLDPDWLSRLLAEMAAKPKQGILSLNNPHGNVGGDKRHKLGIDGAVTLCERSGGSFMCIRRKLLPKIVPMSAEKSPVSAMCGKARELGWENGYLTQVYCQHIGTISARNGWDLSKAIALIEPVNADTLEPQEAYRD